MQQFHSLFEKKGVLTQQGNRLKYVDSKNKEHLDFWKAWTGDKLDMLMADFTNVTEPEEKTETTEEWSTLHTKTSRDYGAQ